jgi:hypothetical protein
MKQRGFGLKTYNTSGFAVEKNVEKTPSERAREAVVRTAVVAKNRQSASSPSVERMPPPHAQRIEKFPCFQKGLTEESRPNRRSLA